MKALSLAVLLLGSLPVAVASAQEPAPDYAREVRPVLDKACFSCHGQHRQKAGLRLDQRAAALAGSSFGADPVIVPGTREDSLLWEMITLEFEDERMPPPGEPQLTAEEVELIGRWLDAGAAMPDDGEEASWPMRHWAYQRPRAPESLPELPPALEPQARTPIDRFLFARLHEAGLTPQAEADRGVLLRRAALDLTGLPPTVEELDAFLDDDAGDAWGRAIDRLMASPHYGERQAQRWLDLARYADSNGYEKDADRSIWPYRDWVVEAYQRDIGYDEFTVLQLAGDLLPEADQQARVATGFHRNTMTNEEGGTDEEEFRVAAVQDRVDTTAAVWLGSTVACAQCHNHKYDPFTQRDYYQLFAYFNQTRDGGRTLGPMLDVVTPRTVALREEAATLIAALQEDFPKEARDFRWVILDPPEASRVEGDWAHAEPEAGATRPRTAEGFEQHFFEGAAAPLTLLPDDLLLLELRIDPEDPPREIMLQVHVEGGNWEHRAFWGEDLQNWGVSGTPSRLPLGELPPADEWQRLTIDPAALALPPGTRIDGLAFGQFDGTVVWGPAGLVTRNPDPSAPLDAHLLRTLRRAGATPTTLVMEAVETPRATHLLEKGSFLSPGVAVEAAIPGVLRRRGMEPPRDRLELARWLVDERNPLTARVEVNRVWQEIFGVGLVATVDDFGSQGEAPSHPELLDWLAYEFMQNGWSRKWLLRTIMQSAAYRQDATVTPEALAVDPDNRLLARFPRRRLSGEGLRDLSLVVSGLLVRDIGGPPVKPPQPPGIDAGTYAGDRWRTAEGPDRYRRGLYTFWRRTSPYPTFMLFDATSRELTCARRDSSDTPLQALALLNDPAFVEAAAAFAGRIASHEGDDAARLNWAFRSCTGRHPDAAELELLDGLRTSQGWESVARVLLNLDETVVRG